MKACCLLLLSLLLFSINQAQDRIKYKFQPVVNQNLNINQSSPDYDCIPPTDFDVHIYTIGYDQYMLYLTWDMESQYSEWIHWDDGENYTATVAGSDDLYAAARWDSGQLVDYHGFKITKIRAFLYESGYSDLVFHIWISENAHNTVYSAEHDTLLGGDWVVHNIDTALYLDSSLEYWVGYSIYVDTVGRFYLGCDKGEAITGYGDKISVDGNTWDNLSDFGLDYNFNIQFFAEDTSGDQKQISRGSGERYINFLGYNLYQSLNGGEYDLLDFIPSENDSNYYALPLDASPDLNCYKLTALWISSTDTCESAPAIAKDNPEQDYVCVLLVGESEINANKDTWVQCSPNPFANSTTIEYKLDHPSAVTITIFNHLGEQVEEIRQHPSSGRQQIIWDAKGLPVGIYYFRLQAGEQVATGKLVLMR